MQEEQQQSVSEILSSIRQVLSKEAASLKDDYAKQEQSSSMEVSKEEIVFELTPQMQVMQGSLIDSDTAVRTQTALDKLNKVKQQGALSEQVESELRPLLREWLNTNLPELVERIVTQEVQRLINR